MHVKFGISPFGIGRPGSAAGIRGFDQYEKLYADAALWLRKGWCDYFTPQLYWPVEQKGQEFPLLFDDWIGENTMGRHIWPGLFTSRVIDGKRKWEPKTVLDQIGVLHFREEKSDGHVHFSMKALMVAADGLAESLIKQTYAIKALVPASPWLNPLPPATPEIALATASRREHLALKAKAADHFLWSVWTLDANGWLFDVIPGVETAFPLSASTFKAVVASVDRAGAESERVKLQVR